MSDEKSSTCTHTARHDVCLSDSVAPVCLHEVVHKPVLQKTQKMQYSVQLHVETTCTRYHSSHRGILEESATQSLRSIHTDIAAFLHLKHTEIFSILRVENFVAFQAQCTCVRLI